MNQTIDARETCTACEAWPVTGMLVLAIGLGGLLIDSLRVPQPRMLNAHLIFGIALLAVVTRNLLRESLSGGNSLAEHYYLYTRHLARQVYLLLYLLAAVRVCLYFVESAEAKTSGRAFSYVLMRSSLEDFHVYIGYGLVAACLIRGSTMLLVPR